jgi:hypothetical protein
MSPTGTASGRSGFRRWGSYFRDGKFYLFTNGTMLVVRGWPELRAWRKTPTRPWQQVRPELRLGHPDLLVADHTPRTQRLPRELAAQLSVAGDDERDELAEGGLPSPPPPWLPAQLALEAEARQRLAATFPPDIQAVLAPFAARQWHLAVLLARCPGALDLVRSNPALAFCLASSWCFRRQPVRWPLRSVRRLLKRRQRDMLAWLGFPATESMVRLLRKVPPAACQVPHLLNLRRIARDSWSVPYVRHLPRLNATALTLLACRGLRAELTPRLVREMTEAAPDGEVSATLRLLEDTWEMGILLGGFRHPPFASLRQLRRTHDALVQELRRDHARRAAEEAIPFPPPPLPGTPDILPLTTAADLVQEGEEMRHCVAIYGPRVWAGECYVYRVLRPTRATVSLVRQGRRWELEQVAGIANAEVPANTVATVRHWVASFEVRRPMA